MCLAMVMKNMLLFPGRQKENQGEVKVGIQDGVVKDLAIAVLGSKGIKRGKSVM